MFDEPLNQDKNARIKWGVVVQKRENGFIDKIVISFQTLAVSRVDTKQKGKNSQFSEKIV